MTGVTERKGCFIVEMLLEGCLFHTLSDFRQATERKVCACMLKVCWGPNGHLWKIPLADKLPLTAKFASRYQDLFRHLIVLQGDRDPHF